MIPGMERVQAYQSVIGQLPQWHAWLLDNERLIAFLQWLAPGMPDPLNDIRVVGPNI